jgi:hypothetical protein
MGQIINAIAAIDADSTKTADEKKRLRAIAKLDGWADSVQKVLPYTVTIDASRAVEFTGVDLGLTQSGQFKVVASGVFRRDGVDEAWDWPWILVNPPVAVPSSQGQSEWTKEREDGSKTVHYREDLAEAIRLLCDRAFP